MEASRNLQVLAINSEGWTSLLTVLSILLLQYLITALTPLMRRNNYSGYGREDYEMLSELENMIAGLFLTVRDSCPSRVANPADASGIVKRIPTQQTMSPRHASMQ